MLTNHTGKFKNCLFKVKWCKRTTEADVYGKYNTPVFSLPTIHGQYI